MVHLSKKKSQMETFIVKNNCTDFFVNVKVNLVNWYIIFITHYIFAILSIPNMDCRIFDGATDEI